MVKFNWFIDISVVFLLLLTIKYSNGFNKKMTIRRNYKTLLPNDYKSIYYDLGTNSTVPIAGLTMDETRRPLFPVKFFSTGLPCSCVSLKCGCCAGLNITAINLDHRVCANVTVVPEEFALDFDLIMDNDRVFTNRVTARNPPPACVPLYFFPAITFCVRFYDLYFSNDKLNVCIDFETQIIQWPLLILHFNCLNLGGNGVTWIRPPHADALVVGNLNNTEIYDNLNIETTEYNGYLNTSTLKPDNI